MSVFTYRSLGVYGAVLITTVVAIFIAGCAVDHLKMSMDRGAVSPKIESTWLDHTAGLTNTP